MKRKRGQPFITSLVKGRIGRRLVISTIIFSALITLSTSSYQLYADYRHDLNTIHGYFTLIQNSYARSLSNSVWLYDSQQIATQLDGLSTLPDMEYLEILSGEGYAWSSGSLRSEHTVTQAFPLKYMHMGRTFSIGVLNATASLDNIYDRLIGKAITILVANGVRAFFVSGFILLIFQFFVTRHLVELADRVRKIDLKRAPERIVLTRKKRRSEPDEIDQVVRALDETQSELHASYDALKRSEDELNRIFSMSIDLICVADINTSTFIRVNPAFSETLGYAEKELTTRPFTAFIHPDDAEPTRQMVEEQLKAGRKVINFENRYRCKDGSFRWLRWVSHPLPEEGITYAVAHDISETKASVHELEASHQRFLTVLDAIDAHIYVADMQDHRILFINEKMKQDFGRDLIGESCWSVFRGETGPCEHCTNDQIVDAKGRPSDVCVWQGRNPLTGKWYINHDRAIQWVDGRLVRLQIATDISPLKEMEEALRQSHKMEAVGTLAGGIAHDFNNLLHMIIGNVELALEDLPESNPVHVRLKEIKAAGMRAAGIVRQLLNYSRKNEQALKPIGLVAVIEDALKFLRSTIPATIEIRKRLPETNMAILADPIQIHQVMMNVCTNAAQAMEPEGGVLEITGESVAFTAKDPGFPHDLPPGNYAKITVSDTGSGVAPEIVDRIFDPYFTTKETGKGSGMGLAVVHGIVKSYGGAISVDGSPGKGATFTLLFPVAAEQPEPTVPVHDESPRGSEAILLVDDEDAVLKMSQTMLERLGYRVEPKTNPLEALALFRAGPERFDLIITDMTMPQMTGVRLSEEIRRVRSEIPVIISTGYSTLIDAEKAKELGIAAFVMKPMAKRDLAEAVRKVLDPETQD